MSKPFKGYTDPIVGALNELVSGMSSLNMPPEAIKGAENKFYISDKDVNVKHAMEHFQEAFIHLKNLHQKGD